MYQRRPGKPREKTLASRRSVSRQQIRVRSCACAENLTTCHLYHCVLPASNDLNPFRDADTINWRDYDPPYNSETFFGAIIVYSIAIVPDWTANEWEFGVSLGEAMFSRPEQLIKRTGKKGVGRHEYLQQLVNEFQDTDSLEAKLQVLANLVNFAYDPINYEFLRQLKVLDLFLDQLSEDDTSLVRFSLAGLCNLCLDTENKDYIIHSGGVRLVTGCLSSVDEETVLNAITTLMYLVSPLSKSDITSPQVIECMLRFSTSRNARLRNLAMVFLEDYCLPEEVDTVKNTQSQFSAVDNIPLPRVDED
uniref:Armadillo repeat-containing protein 7 n=1 Tax=Timema monikensis TaxID=170555 RepID=A0A7R9EH37_9NEOP|nr:unnamed protein product [Timema monikensis]